MPDDPTPPPDERRERRRQLKKLRQRLAEQREAWSRWMPRLKRAFHAVEKLDRRICRLERQIDRLTNP